MRRTGFLAALGAIGAAAVLPVPSWASAPLPKIVSRSARLAMWPGGWFTWAAGSGLAPTAMAFEGDDGTVVQRIWVRRGEHASCQMPKDATAIVVETYDRALEGA